MWNVPLFQVQCLFFYLNIKYEYVLLLIIVKLFLFQNKVNYYENKQN